MRDHLDRGAEIIAATLAREDVLIDPPGRDVVVPRCRPAREALVVTEIEIGLSAVVGDEDLAMLIRRHRPWIDIEVGIEFAKADLVAARLQQRTERRGSKTLTE